MLSESEVKANKQLSFLTRGSNSAGKTAISCQTESQLRVKCYCEENVWRLAFRRICGLHDSVKNSGGKENVTHHVVFISNTERCCPMLYQKASEYPLQPCYWDYHVILIESTNIVVKGKSHRNICVLDMDSCLEYPTSLQVYLNRSFGELALCDGEKQQKLKPLFRVIPANSYLQHFSSDRTHMKKRDGTWLAPPPTYECITSSSSQINSRISLSNLDEFIDMTENKSNERPYLGEVVNMEQLQSKFS
eukprot:806486_1